MTDFTLTLRRGESRLLHVAAGSRWEALRGSVCLVEPPSWLGERLLHAEATLGEGDSHTVERRGLVALHAQADSVIGWSVPAPQWRAWAARGLARWRIMQADPAARLPA